MQKKKTRTDVAAYIRVSSDSQSYATQRADILRASKARGDAIAQWFHDRGKRDVLTRPELTKLRALVKSGEVRRLYIFALDRLTEGTARLLTIVKELHDGGCEIVSLHDPFPLDGPMAEIAIAWLGWFAQQERKRTNERLAAARARIEGDGGHWGRPRRVGPADERRIRELGERLTMRQVAKRTRIPLATVARVLSQKGPYGRTAKTRVKRG
ncbi:MAG TPA: recombinase family protein [Casimicrobiaceae bacterium]